MVRCAGCESAGNSAGRILEESGGHYRVPMAGPVAVAGDLRGGADRARPMGDAAADFARHPVYRRPVHRVIAPVGGDAPWGGFAIEATPSG